MQAPNENIAPNAIPVKLLCAIHCFIVQNTPYMPVHCALEYNPSFQCNTLTLYNYTDPHQTVVRLLLLPTGLVIMSNIFPPMHVPASKYAPRTCELMADFHEQTFNESDFCNMVEKHWPLNLAPPVAHAKIDEHLLIAIFKLSNAHWHNRPLRFFALHVETGYPHITWQTIPMLEDINPRQIVSTQLQFNNDIPLVSTQVTLPDHQSTVEQTMLFEMFGFAVRSVSIYCDAVTNYFNKP